MNHTINIPMPAKPKQRKKDITLNDIFEIVLFIKENAASKEDLKELASKDDLKPMATTEAMEKGFSDIRVELRGIRNDLEDIKASLAELEKKTQEDDDAVANEYVWLKKKVQTLEQRVKVLEKSTPE